jgi:hypothetical protein
VVLQSMIDPPHVCHSIIMFACFVRLGVGLVELTDGRWELAKC